MSSPKTSKYTFLPWVKTGLGVSISNNEQELKGPRAKIQTKLSVKRYNGIDNPLGNIYKDYFLYGPGDVEGILNSVIIRIEPSANNLNFEPNYFPFIEFSQPDFPWRYTPAKPINNQLSGRLSPWISLIVLEEDEFDRRPIETGSLPRIAVRNPQTSLPDPKQSWAWAHTQVVQELENPESFKKILLSEPHKVTSRILSLRRLKPNNHYHAFLVPTFELGRCAGLKISPAGDATGTSFAWKIDGSSQQHLLLPVYYQWKFSTSSNGDFESLAKKLKYRELIEDVGLKKLDVSKAFLSLINKMGFEKPLFFGGAIWSNLAKELVTTKKKINIHTYRIEGDDPQEENPSPDEIKEFIMEMKELVDLGERLTWSFVKGPVFSNECKDPIISPPMYGKWHARKKIVSNIIVSNISDDYEDPLWIKSLGLDPPNALIDEIGKYSPNESMWLEEINLDPTNRVAAGLGAMVIQNLQEELMASAWDQAGQLRESNKRLRNFQLAREISSNLYNRCFKPMERDVLIAMANTFNSRVIVEHENKSLSVKHWLRDGNISESIFSPAFTKISTRYLKTQRRRFDFKPGISTDTVGSPSTKGIGSVDPVTLETSEPRHLITIDYLVDFPILKVTESGFRGQEFMQYLENGEKREVVKSIENSIPSADATVNNLQAFTDKEQILEKIYQEFKNSLNPEYTIEAKALKEVIRLERLQEEMKDKLDPIVAYPEFKRPMFEPLRDLVGEFLLPGTKNIPQNTIGILQTNPTFINSYMVGLNHEMARELLWRGYPTDQRGSYFRQFWDASAAVERERLKHFQSPGTLPSEEDDEKIIEKYRDIPEIHRWKDSQHQDLRRVAQSEEEAQPEKQALLIRGELLNRYPGTVIYAVKAKLDHINNIDRPILSNNDEDIKEPVFRGTISPDITFIGFDISFEELLEVDENGEYFFMLQEQPSEPRFAIDNDDGTAGNTLPQSWNELQWHHVEPSLGSNNYIDLETGPLKELKLEGITWGDHAAALAYILLQQPFRIAIRARDLLKSLLPDGG
jgi:hypothetical protein